MRIPPGARPDGTPDWWQRAVFTPGHDRGHVACHEHRDNGLIAGDRWHPLR